jgi:hypothetical protein
MPNPKPTPLPTQERLQELFEYSVVTGLLYHRQGPRKGLPAGGQKGNSRGYAISWIDNVYYKTHRVIWVLVTGVDPATLDVDHKDGDRLNNAWHNLRLATRSQNLANQQTSSTNTSGFKGVTWQSSRQRWVAQIRHHGQLIHIGRYATPEEAHAAYMEAAHQLKGEFARAA